jgi:hypothetical protein
MSHHPYHHLCHLLGTYSVPHSVLSALHLSSHLIHTKNTIIHFYPHCTVEEANVQKGNLANQGT